MSYPVLGHATPVLEPGDQSIVGTEDMVTVTPTVIRHTKTIIAPEGETATGPNYPRTVRLTVDIATGETVNNVVVTDTLDAGTVVRGGDQPRQ